MCILQWQGTFFSVLLPVLDCFFQGQFGAQVSGLGTNEKHRISLLINLMGDLWAVIVQWQLY